MTQDNETAQPAPAQRNQTKPAWRIIQGALLVVVAAILLSAGASPVGVLLGVLAGAAGLTLFVLGIVKQVNG